jgi:hypothetical protein
VISIASLIYRSPRYADAVWSSAQRHTPHLSDGRARFFFVANDPTEDLLAHLERRGYPYVLQRNDDVSEEALAAMGFAPPAYIHRVYRGWNRAIRESEDVCVLVNSDMMFSPGWLDALLRLASPSTAVASKLVERRHPKHGVFRGAYTADFGSHPDNFDEDGFLDFCDKVREEAEEPGYAFSPIVLDRAAAIRAGLYPEGNIARPGQKPLYGDREFFGRLAREGVAHITAKDSLVYHFKEGEMSE